MRGNLPPPRHYLHNAAFLRREFLGRSRILRGQRELHDKTIYFFDTDIFVSYCTPWFKGPLKYFPDNQIGDGYGEIFASEERPSSGESDRNDLAMSVCSILAEFLIHHLRPDGHGLYQFEGHFRETEHIFDNARRLAGQARSRTAKQEPVQKSDEMLRRMVALIGYQSNPEGTIDILPIIDRLLNRIGEAGFPKQPDEQKITEWGRFEKLLVTAGGVFLPDAAAQHLPDGNDALPDEMRRVLSTSNFSEMENAEYQRRTVLVEQKLQKKGAAVGGSENLRADAAAIAHLSLINEASGESGWRAVFVTGSTSLVGACNAGLEFDLKDNPGGFTGRYIRHFWAYVTEALLEQRADTKAVFLTWLDGMLVKASDGIRFDRSTLTELIGKHSSSKPADPHDSKTQREVAKQWRELVHKAASTHRIALLGLNEMRYEPLRHRIVERINQGRSGAQLESWNALIEAVYEEYQRAKDATYVDYSLIGWAVLVKELQNGGLRQRNPPDLAFETLRNANRIFRRLCSAEGYKTAKIKEDFGRLIDDCRVSDHDRRQLHYLQFLVIGAFFAAANKWISAQSQAERAIAIVERAQKIGQPIPTQEGRTNMSGREAYFLAAVASRVNAQRSPDLTVSRKYLEQAQLALRTDHEKGTAKNTLHLRFVIEELARSLSVYYHKRMDKDPVPSNPEITTEDENRFCDEDAQQVYHSAADVLSEIAAELEKHGQPDKRFGDNEASFRREDGRYWIGRVTLVHCAVNIVQVCAIRAFRRLHERTDEFAFPICPDDLRQSVDILNYFTNRPLQFSARETDDRHRLRRTILIQRYLDIGLLMLGQAPAVENAGPASGESPPVVTVYDPWRFERLRELREKLTEREISTRCALVFGESAERESSHP